MTEPNEQREGQPMTDAERQTLFDALLDSIIQRFNFKVITNREVATFFATPIRMLGEAVGLDRQELRAAGIHGLLVALCAGKHIPVTRLGVSTWAMLAGLSTPELLKVLRANGIKVVDEPDLRS